MQIGTPLSLSFLASRLPPSQRFNLDSQISRRTAPTYHRVKVEAPSITMLVKVVAPLLAVFLAVTSADLVGAPVDADINNPEVQEALRFAVARFNSESNSVYTSHVVKVISVQTQVVAGVMYIFTIEMAQSSCKKGEAEHTCTINSDPAIAQPHECKLAVWSQPWENSMQLTENSC